MAPQEWRERALANFVITALQMSTRGDYSRHEVHELVDHVFDAIERKEK